MSDTLTEQEAEAFRQKCNDFLETYAFKPGQGIPTYEDQKAFLAAAAGAGLAGVVHDLERGRLDPDATVLVPVTGVTRA